MVCRLVSDYFEMHIWHLVLMNRLSKLTYIYSLIFRLRNLMKQNPFNAKKFYVTVLFAGHGNFPFLKIWSLINFFMIWCLIIRTYNDNPLICFQLHHTVWGMQSGLSAGSIWQIKGMTCWQYETNRSQTYVILSQLSYILYQSRYITINTPC